ncbi:MAG: magnesium transporter [Ruminococcus callidus]
MKRWAGLAVAGLTAEEDLNEPLKQSVKKHTALALPAAAGMLVSVSWVHSERWWHADAYHGVPVADIGYVGNVGTQSLAVTIRVLMTRTLRPEQAAAGGQEMRVGFFNGLILGALSFAMVGLYIMLFTQDHAVLFAVSGCIGVSLILAM